LQPRKYRVPATLDTISLCHFSESIAVPKSNAAAMAFANYTLGFKALIFSSSALIGVSRSLSRR